MSDAVPRLNQSLEGRYRIESELGAGGMARVYLAEDLKHDRKVAIKVMRPELGMAAGADRFLQEIRVTANLQHPHILPLFDSGQADSMLYFVMPYVAGETLADRLRREHRLELDEAVSIGKSVAAALHYAHQQNVVHRDIKPENVMLSDGLPLVADFGIAGAIEIAGIEGDRLTQPGKSVGTIGYCSPEQAAGDTLDQRADVYALGSLMYEMVTGELPYVADTGRSMLAKLLVDPVPSPKRLRKDLPEHLDAAIRRALAKEPDDRFASAAEMGLAMAESKADSIQVKEALAIAPSGRTEFVGREQEWGTLLSALDDAVEGHGSIVLLGGEPGVGKTRLAEEILLEAQRRELLCFIGHAYEGEGSVPYTPFVETLDYAARALPEDVFRSALGSAAPEVARIMPKLRDLFPDIPPSADLPTEQQRRYLFNSYREFVERGTRISPIVVWLDDIHWADESSLLLLEHLAQHVPTQRTLIVGTYRNLEAEISPALARTLANLTRQRLAIRINVEPLGEQAVGDLLTRLNGAEPPAALRAAVYRETEGNAFFVEEVYRDLAERGEIIDGDGHWVEDADLEGLVVPEGVRYVLDRRLERVGEDVQAVLTAGGVIGRSFGDEMLQALELVPADALFDALDKAEAAHLVESSSVGRETHYRFSHELVRSTLVGRLTVSKRRQMHHRIVGAMESLYEARLDERAADFGYHLYEAGSRVSAEKVIRFLDLAAGQALDSVAFQEALYHIDRALEVGEVDQGPDYARLLAKKGEAHRGLGDWESAVGCWLQALPLLEELDEPDLVAEICMTLGEVESWAGRVAEWEAFIERGLRAVGEDASVTRSRLTATLGHVVAHGASGGSLEEGLSHVDRAIEMGRALEQESCVSFAKAVAVSSLCNHGLVYETIRTGDECIDALRQQGLHWRLAEVLSQVQYLHMTSGDLERCKSITAEVRSLSKSVGHVGALLIEDMTNGHVQFMLPGHLDRHIEWAESNFEKWVRVFAWAHYFGLFGAIGHHWRGDWDAGLSKIEAAVEGFPEGWWKGRISVWHLLMNAYSETGRAREIYEDQKHRIPESPEQTSWGGDKAFALVATEALATMGDLDAAAALYPVARAAVDGGMIVWESGLSHRYLGISAACAGDWDAAEEHFATAAEQARSLPFRVELPDTLRWHGWALLQRGAPGDDERARNLLLQAIDRFDRLGMRRHVGLAEGLL